MRFKEILLATALLAVSLVGMGQMRRVIRGSAWFEQNVSPSTNAAQVLSVLGVSGGGGGGSGGTVGSVINTVAPAAAGVPLVSSGTNPTNVVPGYTSGSVQYVTGSHTILYTDNRAVLRHADATNVFETFQDGATNGFEVVIKNIGAGSVIVTNASGKTFDTLTSITFPAGTVAAIRGDGTNYITGRISPKTIATAYTVYASPADGSSGVPAMRSLVAADAPTLAPIANPTFTGTVTSTNGFFAGSTGVVQTATSIDVVRSPIVVFPPSTGTTNNTDAFKVFVNSGNLFGGEADPSVYWGWNADAANSVNPYTRWVMEQNYFHAGQRDFEVYLEVKTGGVITRPIFWFGEKTGVGNRGLVFNESNLNFTGGNPGYPMVVSFSNNNYVQFAQSGGPLGFWCDAVDSGAGIKIYNSTFSNSGLRNMVYLQGVGAQGARHTLQGSITTINDYGVRQVSYPNGDICFFTSFDDWFSDGWIYEAATFKFQPGLFSIVSESQNGPAPSGTTNMNQALLPKGAGGVGIATTNITSTLHVAGSMAHSIATGSAITLGQTNEFYLVSTDAQLVTLPTAVGIKGRTYTVKVVAPATTATLTNTSAQKIDGALSFPLTASNKWVRVISDNAAWWVIGNN